MASEFRGIELGGYVNIFRAKIVYIIAGFKLHWNEKVGRTGIGTRGAQYKLPALGLGFKYRILTVEMMFHKPYPFELQ
jgi:hypothetical protein